MAVTPMKLVSVIGPLQLFDETIQKCVIDREFHPEFSQTYDRKISGLGSFESRNPYSETLRKAVDISKSMGIGLDYADYSEIEETPEDIKNYFNDLDSRYSALLDSKKELNAVAVENQQILLQLGHVKDLDANLNEFFNVNYVKFRFGRIPKTSYHSFEKYFEDDPNIYFIPTSAEGDYIYGMYLTPRPAMEKVDSLFNSLHFERIRISDKVRGSAEEAAAALKEETDEAFESIKGVESKLSEIVGAERHRFLACYCKIRFLHDSYDVRKYASHSGKSFHILGWVPETNIGEFIKNFDSYESLTCIVDDDSKFSDYTPPTKLRNNPFSRLFEPMVSMYGLPTYGEIDPTPLMSVLYTLLFGVMFGDVGQGFLLSVLGFVMWRTKRMWLGRILVFTGISSMVFGVIYGSVFGFEHIFPWQTFNILENTNTLLLVSVAGGCLVITCAMIMNIINGVRQKDYEKIFFSPNGLAGFLLYWGLVITLLSIFFMELPFVNTWFTIFLIAIPVILIVLRHPLGKLAARRKSWKPDSIGNFLLENLFELFEVVLSYATNTISFLRVGAFAISHASMMMVVFLLARGSGQSENLVVVILGNALVMCLEALLVGIQVMRLQFYEFFGRFYDGGGREYRPVIIDYKSLNE